MKICVTGFEGGMVRDTLVGLGVQPINADITDELMVHQEISRLQPDVVIHAAAITDVDRCENDKKLAFEVNVRGTTYVAEACEDIGAKMIYLSTCHVFDGKGTNAYTEHSIPRPINNYGMTKWMGEIVAQTFTNPTIVRISKLYSKKMFKESYSNGVAVESEQLIRPTFITRNYTHVEHFCRCLLTVAETSYNFPGVINISSIDSMSDYDFWHLIFKELDLDYKALVPRHIDDISFVPRPHYGVLSVKLAQSRWLVLPEIRDGINVLIKDLKK